MIGTTPTSAHGTTARSCEHRSHGGRCGCMPHRAATQPGERCLFVAADRSRLNQQRHEPGNRENSAEADNQVGQSWPSPARCRPLPGRRGGHQPIPVAKHPRARAPDGGRQRSQLRRLDETRRCGRSWSIRVDLTHPGRPWAITVRRRGQSHRSLNVTAQVGEQANTPSCSLCCIGLRASTAHVTPERDPAQPDRATLRPRGKQQLLPHTPREQGAVGEVCSRARAKAVRLSIAVWPAPPGKSCAHAILGPAVGGGTLHAHGRAFPACARPRWCGHQEPAAKRRIRCGAPVSANTQTPGQRPGATVWTQVRERTDAGGGEVTPKYTGGDVTKVPSLSPCGLLSRVRGRLRSWRVVPATWETQKIADDGGATPRLHRR